MHICAARLVGNVKFAKNMLLKVLDRQTDTWYMVPTLKKLYIIIICVTLHIKTV